MPKASPLHDSSKPVHDDKARISDVALRKKKNADAQAAFRARRANYIATLEETVTSLESVVLQLQESNRDSRAEIHELKQHFTRLRLEYRERERYWRTLWQTKAAGQGGPDDMPPLPPPSSAPMLHSGTPTIGQPQLQYPQDETLSFRNDESCAATLNGSDHSSYTTSPSIPLLEPDAAMALEDSGRLQRYNQYNYGHPRDPRDQRWALQQAGMLGGAGMPTADSTPHGQSPVYLDSPSLTSSDMAYPGRAFGAPEEQKVVLHHVLENAPYTFSGEDARYGPRVAEGVAVPASRSISPSASNAPSTSSTLAAPGFQFTFTDTAGQPNDRRDMDFRRHSLPHGGEVTLHGGTADISSMPGPQDALRYRIGNRKHDPIADQQQQNHGTTLSTIPALSGRGSCSSGQNDRAGSSESDATSLTSRQRRRRGPLSSSRSPSPGPAPLSCTVAVIKAQAFGQLRRTRARAKKSSEGAAKVALDVLEARGIGLGVSTSSKRPRIDTGSLETQH